MHVSARRLIHGVPILAIFLASFALALAGAVPAAAATLYVIPSGGAASGACDSWAAACTLQTALGTAAGSDEVWVEAGTYKPGVHQGDTFTIPPGVAVYGGFAGAETSLGERDPAVNVTILSGDIDNNDTNMDGNDIDETTTDIQGSNSGTVVTMDGTTGTNILASTVLDGFTITGGSGSLAGGLWCDAEGTFHECSPTLANLTFSGNFRRAIFNDALSGGTSSPTLTNVTFSGNSAGFDSLGVGGAMFNDAGCAACVSSPTLTDVTFRGNSATNGGAIYNNGGGQGTSSPVLTKVTFSDNSASTNGGAIYNDGEDGTSSPVLTNVTFSGNSAGERGGAIYNFGGLQDSFGVSSPVLTNVTFSGNSAGIDGGAMYDAADLGSTSAPTLTNVIFWGDSLGGLCCGLNGRELSAEVSILSSATVDHSVYPASAGVCGTYGTCTNIVTTDPLLGPLQDNGGPTETMALGTGSSAIDTGTNTGCPATDQRGVARPLDGDGDRSAICDIGAYEFNTLFSDGFETGDTSLWSATTP